jgi:hypothetical protein
VAAASRVEAGPPAASPPPKISVRGRQTSRKFCIHLYSNAPKNLAILAFVGGSTAVFL